MKVPHRIRDYFGLGYDDKTPIGELKQHIEDKEQGNKGVIRVFPN